MLLLFIKNKKQKQNSTAEAVYLAAGGLLPEQYYRRGSIPYCRDSMVYCRSSITAEAVYLTAGTVWFTAGAVLPPRQYTDMTLV